MTVPHSTLADNTRNETGIIPLYCRSKIEFGEPHPFRVIWPWSTISLKVRPDTSRTSVAPGPPAVAVAVKGTLEPAPRPVTFAVPSDHSLRPVFYDLVIASKHGELLLVVQDMEVRAVAVDARNRCGTIPVVYEALRDSDPLEDRVGRA
jgi:hypothetical protein